MNAIALQKNTKGILTPKKVNVKKPVPTKKQLLLRVEYAALDTAIVDVMQQTFLASFLHAKVDPLVVGWHYCGTVEAIGPEADSTEVAVGEAVFGHLPYDPSTIQGSLSEFLVVESSECAKVPANAALSRDIYAAATTEAGTALQSLRDLAAVKPGSTVLVLGAGGGVGSAAVGIAKALGAKVTAVCSSKDRKLVKDLGADRVLGRDELIGDVFDVVFDTPAKYAKPSTLKMLKKGGAYVTTLPSFGLLWTYLVSLLSSKSVQMVQVKSVKDDLEWIAELLEASKLKVSVDAIYKIKDIDKAIQRQMEPSSKKNGRVVVAVSNAW